MKSVRGKYILPGQIKGNTMALDLVCFKKPLTSTRQSSRNEKTFHISKNREGGQKRKWKAKSFRGMRTSPAQLLIFAVLGSY